MVPDICPGGKASYIAPCSEDCGIVIQSRGQFGNPEDYFNRGWEEYADGFGEPGIEQVSPGYSCLNLYSKYKQLSQMNQS